MSMSRPDEQRRAVRGDLDRCREILRGMARDVRDRSASEVAVWRTRYRASQSVIAQLSTYLEEVQAESAARLVALEEFQGLLARAQGESAARLEALDEIQRLLAQVQGESSERFAALDEIQSRLARTYAEDRAGTTAGTLPLSRRCRHDGGCHVGRERRADRLGERRP